MEVGRSWKRQRPFKDKPHDDDDDDVAASVPVGRAEERVGGTDGSDAVAGQ